MAPYAHGPASAGLVLAGGRSSRFGSDKAGAKLNGLTFLDIAARALKAGGRPVAVSAAIGSSAADLAAELGLPVLPDRLGDPVGPLSGVRAGLDWSRTIGARSLAVRAIDTPLLPYEIHDQLLAALIAVDAPAAFCVTLEGPQPLCSVWTPAVLPQLETALVDGRHPAVHRFLADIGAVQLSVDLGAAFTNLNTEEDLRNAQSPGGN